MRLFPLLTCLTALASGLLPAAEARADYFHQQSLIVGDRAAGMGGAFAAVADDPSAIYYNPAGLAQLDKTELSLTANTFRSSRTKIDGLFDRSYRAQSTELVPVFFGGAALVDFAPLAGWVLGYAIIVPDVERSQRDDEVRNDARNNIIVWNHSFFIDQETTMLAAALAQKGRTFDVGFGLAGVRINSLLLQSINARFGPFNDPEDPEHKDVFFNQMTDRRVEIDAYAAELGAGLLWRGPAGWRVGVSAKVREYLRQKQRERSIDRSIYTAADGQAAVLPEKHRNQQGLLANDDLAETNHPFGWLAGGWRAALSRRWDGGGLICAELVGNSTNPHANAAFTKRSTLDAAVGGAFNLTPDLTQSFGLFTNGDARPRVSGRSRAGAESVQYVGATAGGSLRRAENVYSGGVAFQWGRGAVQLNRDYSAAQTELVQSVALSFGLRHAI